MTSSHPRGGAGRPPRPTLWVLAFALALGACGSGADLAPGDAPLAARAAVEAGDAERALDLYGVAADAGDLGALRAVAEARRRGHLTRRSPAGAVHLAVQSAPGEADRAERTYRAALADSARAGSADALLTVALDLVGGPTLVNGEVQGETPAAARDSAAAIYRRIASADVPRLPLALLAQAVGDPAGYAHHVDEAVRAGEPGACTVQVWHVGAPRDLTTPEGLAAHVDALEGCPGPDGAGPAQAREDVRRVVAATAGGDAEAVAFLAGLRATGLFERHPHLAPAPDARPARGGAASHPARP